MGYTDKEKAAAYAREWRRAHAQKVLEDDRKRREEERERDPHAASERMRKWRVAHPDKTKIHAREQSERQKADPAYKEKQRAYQAKHLAKPGVRESRRAYTREWRREERKNFPERQRWRSLNYNYGLTREQYEVMVTAQEGKCAICRVDKPGGKGKFFHVDHCHDSDRVRELLCHGCNTGLGAFKDDSELLRAAAAYLEKHQQALTIP